VDVRAQEEVEGCGAPGRGVTFRVGGRAMAPTAVWDTRQVWLLSLQPASQLFLPLITE